MFTIDYEPKYSRTSFVKTITHGCTVLDVGCGNNSAQWMKTIRPDIFYIGLDVCSYNNQVDPAMFADEYITATPEGFADVFLKYKNSIDYVISNHNIEHCLQPDAVLQGMIDSLKIGGSLYMAFPCEASAHFPKRGGCLNFYDDSTHNKLPEWTNIIGVLEKNNVTFNFIAKRYRPFPLWLRGLFYEPWSFLNKNVVRDGSTWALYGFESVIWATKQ